MEALLALGGLFFFLVLPILAIVAMVRTSSLSGQIAALKQAQTRAERTVALLEKKLGEAHLTAAAAAAKAEAAMTAVGELAARPAPAAEPAPPPIVSEAEASPPIPESVDAPFSAEEPPAAPEPIAPTIAEVAPIAFEPAAPAPIEPEPVAPVAAEAAPAEAPISEALPEEQPQEQPQEQPAEQPEEQPEQLPMAARVSNLAAALAATSQPRLAQPDVPPRNPARKIDFELKLGGSIFIWIGAVMLALAGAFLVKYSIDVGLLSPAVRVVLGLIMGGVLLGGGQWLRKESPAISQALAAAAVADWFASLFAATSLYHLIPPAFGFVCLALVTGAGIVLALREGPFVGLVGIAGGFITPAIVHSDQSRPGALFFYLFLIQLGTLVLQHKRGWWYLTALGVGGGLLWAAGWSYFDQLPWDQPDAARLAQVWLPLFLLATDVTQLWSLYGKGGVKVSREMMLTARATGIACFAIMAWWLIAGVHRLDDWAFLIALSLAHLVAARRFAKEEVPALVGAALVILAYAAWSPIDIQWSTGGFVDRSWDMIGVGLVLLVAYGVGGFWFAFRSEHPARWAGLSTLGTAFILGGAYLNLNDAGLWLDWSAQALILAALHAAAAYRLDRVRRREPRYTGALGLHCLAASGFLALAVPMQVEHEWIAVSWSFELPVMAYVAWKLDLPWVRRGIWIGAALIVGAVLLSGFPTGEWLIVNRLLYGIGIPCAAMIATARLLKRMPSDREGRLLVMVLELTGAGLLALLVGLEIDHFIGRVAPDSGRNLLRAGGAATAWAGLAFGLFNLYRREKEPDRAQLYAGVGFTLLSCIALVVGCFSVWNPLLGEIDVGGTWILNRLLVAYALPAAMLLLVAERVRLLPVPNSRPAAEALALLAFVTAFFWMALTVRQIVHGSLLNMGGVTGSELYGYAAGWALLLPAMAWVAQHYDLRRLRQAIWIGGLLVLGAIAFSGLPRGEWLLLNPPLFGVGVPLLAMVAASLVLERFGASPDKETQTLIVGLKVAAAALLALLVFLEIDQAIGRYVLDSGRNLLSAGATTSAWLALGLGAFQLYRRRQAPDRGLLYAGMGFTLLACGALAIGCFMVWNPLFGAIEVGSVWIFNRLLIAYALPAALLLLIALRIRPLPEPGGPVVAQGVALLSFATAFLWILMAVRQIVHGSQLAFAGVEGTEFYGYAAGWTLLLPAMAWVGQRHSLPALRLGIWCVATLVLGAIMASGLPRGAWLLLNPPLLGVGVPLAGMIGTALLLERIAASPDKDVSALIRALKLAGAALLALLLWLEIDQCVGRFVTGESRAFRSNALATVAWTLLALGLLRLRSRAGRYGRDLLHAGWGYAALACAAQLVGGLIAFNPLLTPASVGSLWILNWLLAGYLIPAVLLLLLAERLRAQPELKQAAQGLDAWVPQAVGLLALVSGFAWATLAVRQMAHGDYLDTGAIVPAEQYGFSAAWTLYGLLLLGIGTWKRSQMLRYASAVVVLLTVAKVFLVDASDLTGLYRVASFLGLGLSLIGIGYLYQRLLFKPKE